MNNDYLELKKWLEDTRDDPLETMSAFFDARVNDYEEHMSAWKNHYKWMAELLPSSIENLLDTSVIDRTQVILDIFSLRAQ